MKKVNVSRRHLIAGIAAAPIAAGPLSAQIEKPCTLDAPSRSLLKDWPNLARYAADNEKMTKSRTKSDIVFMGDSITQGWPDKRPAFFSSGRVCRGIGGQTTGQMALRMMADVVALKPRMVHIMGGTNDIAGNTGPMTPQQTLDNIEAMMLLAGANGIKVLVGSVPPAAGFPWRPGLETAQAILALNRSLAILSKRRAATFVDYTAALSDGAGGMKAGYAYDGVHPDTAGYKAMERVLEPFIVKT